MHLSSPAPDSFHQLPTAVTEKHFAIVLAQLKTVVLIKEAIKLAFLRLIEYLEHQQLWVRLQAQNSQKQRTFF